MGRVDELRAIGVVVPAHEDPVGLHRCLEALEGAGRSLHIVVVDDASTSPEQAVALEALEAGARVEVLRNEQNLGFAGTSNRGLRRAVERGCDAILLLNQDALVARSTLERLVTALEQRPAAAAVGPRTLSMGASSDGRRTLLFDGSWRRWLPLQQRIPGIGRPEPEEPGAACRTDYLWGHAVLLRTEALRRVGLFDAGFPFYYEDIDLCRRLTEAGWELWAERGELALHDQEDGSRAASSELWRWKHKLRGADLFHRLHYGGLRAPLLNLLNALHESRHLLRHARLRALGHLALGYVHQALRAPLASSPQRLEEHP